MLTRATRLALLAVMAASRAGWIRGPLKSPPIRRGAALDDDVHTLLSIENRIRFPVYNRLADRRGILTARSIYRAINRATATLPSLPAASVAIRTSETAKRLLYIITPVSPDVDQAVLPILFYCHGGGGKLGDFKSYEPFLRHLACSGNLQVISCEYRLGPEHPFDIAYEDVTRSLNDVLHGLDGTPDVQDRPVFLGGDSFGGALAILGFNAIGPLQEKIRGLWLINPATDIAGHYPSNMEFGEGFGLTQQMIDWFCSGLFDGDNVLAGRLLSPVSIPQTERIPPTWLSVGSFDPLRDQIAEFAKCLEASKAPVTHVVEPGLPHNYPLLLGVCPAARRATDQAIRWLKERT